MSFMEIALDRSAALMGGADVFRRTCTLPPLPVRLCAVTDADLIFEGPAALAAKIRAGELTPRELVEATLRRIEELNPRLNAFRVTLADEALAAADSTDLPDGP